MKRGHGHVKRRLSALIWALLLAAALLTGCGHAAQDASATQTAQTAQAAHAAQAAPVAQDIPAAQADLPERGQPYYDVRGVVLYLELYGELPENYITKNEARSLGWSGGSVEEVRAGAAIGGDRFGNREGLLPEKKGRSYTECDIDTLGYGSRGSRRLVFSNDGLYFYTKDHYEHFSEVTVTDEYEVIW